MAYKATCDICKRRIIKLADVVEVGPHLVITGRVETICTKCSAKLEKQTEKLGVYYHNEIVHDLREFILDLVE